jgi:hypothetical protein
MTQGFALVPPALPDDRDVKTLHALLHLIADPKAISQQLERLTELSKAAAQQVDVANTVRAELEAEQRTHDETLASERAEHDKAIAREKSAVAAEHAQRASALDEREAEIARLEAKAKADADAAAKLKASLERKLGVLEQLKD